MISVIGSGTIGSYAAYLLAKQGQEVKLFEEHEKVGIPCHCTGIVTSSLQDIIKLPNKLVVNKLKHVKVVAPNGKSMTAKTKDIVLDRIGFDIFLSEKATDAGAEIIHGHRFEEIKNKQLIFKNNDKIKKIKSDIIIGADGPDSKVRKYVYDKPISKWFGIQAVVKDDFDRETFEAYLGNELCPEFFAWVVPESENSAIVGLATKQTPNIYFEKFMKQRHGDNWKTKITSWRGGMIPEYDPKIKTHKGNIYLVGDAATQIKASTGGGIIPGMKSAEALADSIINKKNYETEWRKKVGFDLWLHLKLRKFLNGFSERDYKRFVELFQDKGLKSMAETLDRDNIGRMLPTMALKSYRFLPFTRHLLSLF